MTELPFSLYLITDLDVAGGEAALLAAVEAALDAVGSELAVQLRDKRAPRPVRRKLGEALRAITRQRGAKLLVNSDPALASEVDADGVHLPDGAEHRTQLPTARSAHGPAGLRADDWFATLSPVLASPGKGRPLGWDAFRDATRDAPIPVVALGGIRPLDAARARECGAGGVACIRGVLAASNPAGAAREYVRAFRGAPA